ncbi:MAG: zinc ribbon domain-containing protein [Actinobacteria bacterium]|nr:zinc ribbon domain-containing protein [Actinomycetota bacterium]
MDPLNVQPGDSLLISRYMSRDKTSLFRAGDPVIILDIVVNREMPDYKYLVQSPLTCEYFYLSDNDLQLSPDPFGGDSAPMESLAPEANFAKSVARQSSIENLENIKRSDKFAAFMFISTVGILLFVGAVMLVFMFLDIDPSFSAVGRLFFPFGLFLLVLPVFILVVPVAQRARAVRKYNESRANVLQEQSSRIDSPQGYKEAALPMRPFPEGKEKNLCWRCGNDNLEGADSCVYCGANFTYRYIKNLMMLNTYAGILLIWAAIPFLFLVPLMFGNSQTGTYFKIFLFIYGLSFVYCLMILFPFTRLAGFDREQLAAAVFLSIAPPLCLAYLIKKMNDNTDEFRARDLNHFRKNGGFINHWQGLDEGQVKGITTAYFFDNGELFKYKPEKRIKLLKQAAHMDPLNHRILFHLAREYFALGEMRLGCHELDNALSLFPANAQYLELKAAVTGPG